MSTAARSTVRARAPRGAVGDIRRSTDREDVQPFLEDAAHYPGGYADAVWFPTNEAEVAAVTRAATRLLVVGAQSSLTGGATPFGDVLLSTTRMNAIGTITAERACVGPGVVLSTLDEALSARGLYYPPTPTYDGATVGGTVATNAAGAATFKYGTTRSWVETLTVVLANGDVLDLRRGDAVADEQGGFDIVATDGTHRRVMIPAYHMPELAKVSAGYFAAPGMDLVDLFIGSEGTLGIVTAIELRVMSRPAGWFVAFLPVADDASALRLTADLREESRATWAHRDDRGIDVAAIEYIDRRSLALLRDDGADARDGVPLPAGAGAALLVQAELGTATAGDAYDELATYGDPADDSALGRLCRLLERHGALDAAIVALPGDEARRRALFALREAVPVAVNRRIAEAKRNVDPAISKSGGDVIVPFARLAEALSRYRAICETQGLDYAIWGHLSDGNLHPNVLPRTADEMRRAREAQLAIGAAAIELGGCPMSEHGTGRNAVKQELLERLYGAAGIAAMRAVKHALDPDDKLAPGVVFPAATA